MNQIRMNLQTIQLQRYICSEIIITCAVAYLEFMERRRGLITLTHLHFVLALFIMPNCTGMYYEHIFGEWTGVVEVASQPPFLEAKGGVIIDSF